MDTKSKLKIIVFGATGGIGSAICHSLVKDGHDLIVIGHHQEKTNTLVEELKNDSPDCVGYTCDLENFDDLTALSQTITENHGDIDWIIYSVGFIDGTPFQSQTRDVVEKTITLNFTSLFVASQLFINRLATDGGIIAISSLAGLQGNGRYAAYAAAKGAVDSFMKSLAFIFKDANKNQTALTICPGPTNTEMREQLAHDASNHQSPDIIGNLVSDIISKKNHTNGDIIIVKNSDISIQSS